jgi:hypothetical protein
MHTCIHTYIHAYMHTYIHTYMHACIHAYIHTYIHTYIQSPDPNKQHNPINKTTGLWIRTIYGGVPYERQIRDLESGFDILVGTPGRVLYTYIKYVCMCVYIFVHLAHSLANPPQ